MEGGRKALSNRVRLLLATVTRSELIPTVPVASGSISYRYFNYSSPEDLASLSSFSLSLSLSLSLSFRRVFANLIGRQPRPNNDPLIYFILAFPSSRSFAYPPGDVKLGGIDSLYEFRCSDVYSRVNRVVN